jgi:hypothetical protein
MNLSDRVYRWRNWVPIPVDGFRIRIVRWLLLEADRRAVAGALLTLTFAATLGLGRFWTIEMQQLLTETDSVQTVLTQLLSGIILLVSIVVSINSIVLTYDISSLTVQKDRVEGTMDFRRAVGKLVEGERSPTTLQRFLAQVASAMRQRAHALEDELADGEPEAFVDDVETFVDHLEEGIERLETPDEQVGGADFGTLWVGLEANFGDLSDELEAIRLTHADHVEESHEKRFDRLVEAFELFEVGREYFKTLYYSREISEFSRTLLVISLPAILVTAWTILAIDAGTIPSVWLFGLPPLQVFLASTFTISLAPYITLTSYVFRTATVARHTSSSGPFMLD